MNTRNAANRGPRPLVINRDAPVAAVLDRIVASVRPYREFIVLASSLVTAGFVFHNHYITRDEVRVLDCRSTAHIKEIKKRMERESSAPEVARARMMLSPADPSKAHRNSFTPAEQAVANDNNSAEIVISRDKRADDAINEAQARQQPEKCEMLVKANKEI